jgi:hypothetical protein
MEMQSTTTMTFLATTVVNVSVIRRAEEFLPTNDSFSVLRSLTLYLEEQIQ